jgi:ABC-type Na+ efflux pump permease subunit
VGKILVIVIMAFALLFLGISSVVFTTATNWKEATEKQKQKVSELTKKNADATDQIKKAEAELKQAQTNHEAAKKELEGRVASLDQEIKRLQDEITATRGEFEKANQNARSSLAEAEARRNETNLLRDQKAAVEKQANEFKLRQIELIDKIRELTRQLDTATKNNAELRNRINSYVTLLQRANLPTDITQVQGQVQGPPPRVEGEVSRVDQSNRRVEITIGKDDGLVQGHELFLFRGGPNPRYIGKIKLISVDPDQSVGQVIVGPLNGIKIQEGDHVSTTLGPRL